MVSNVLFITSFINCALDHFMRIRIPICLLMSYFFLLLHYKYGRDTFHDFYRNSMTPYIPVFPGYDWFTLVALLYLQHSL